MEKILSIIIPTYNMEALLARCIESLIVEESFMNRMEIIIVNDGSKDSSSAVAHSFSERMPDSIIVIDKENGNYGSCINAALKIATGRYVKICDADDTYFTANMGAFISHLSNCNCDIVVSPYQTLSYQGEVIESTTCPDCVALKELNISQIEWNSNQFRPLRRMHCIATKRENLTAIDYHQSEGISYTDSQFFFYSVLSATTVTFFDKVIYRYYLGRDGQTMSIESMSKNVMHFYINAERLINEFSMIATPMERHKRELLQFQIDSEVGMFIKVVLLYAPNYREGIKRFHHLISLTKRSVIECNVEGYLMTTRYYRLWKRGRVPIPILHLLGAIIKRLPHAERI